MADSTNSVLNTNQRKWLQGEDPYKGRDDRQVKHAIKQRFVQSVSDMALISESDRIDVDDLIKAVIEKNDDEGQRTAHQNLEAVRSKDFQEGFIREAYETVFLQLDTIAKKEIEDEEELASEMQDRIAELTDGYVKNEMYPYFAVLGAYAAMRSVLGTDKAATEWVLNHFPEGEEREDELQKVRESLN